MEHSISTEKYIESIYLSTNAKLLLKLQGESVPTTIKNNKKKEQEKERRKEKDRYAVPDETVMQRDMNTHT